MVPMTGREFYNWQTGGGANDVARLVGCLESADVAWCVIGGVAVLFRRRRATRASNKIGGLAAKSRQNSTLTELSS